MNNFRLACAVAVAWLTALEPPLTAQQAAPLRFVSLSLGAGRTCALTAGGDAYCWGRTESSQPDRVPGRVTGGLHFSAISVGGEAVCGIAGTGTAYCWGVNYRGRLGIDSGERVITAPVPVAGKWSWMTLAVGERHACGVTTAGIAYCWGSNEAGALGTGDTTDRTTPAAVAGNLTLEGIVVGDGYTCGLTRVGQAYCWGDNMFGALGAATTQTCSAARVGLPPPSCSTAPIAVQGGHVFAMLAAGGAHVCGLTSDGMAYCWGNNHLGELGLGDTSIKISTQPLPVAGGLRFSTIGAGWWHTCGLTPDGQAYCWGQNDVGEVGVARPAGTERPVFVQSPVAVSGGPILRSLALGGRHACGLTDGGDAYCWGANVMGDLGDGTGEPTAVPVKVAAPGAVVATENPENVRERDSVELAAVPIDSALLRKALKANPEDLARGFLVETYSLGLARVAATGATVHTAVDGRAQTITRSNAAQFVTRYALRIKTYDAAIHQRGFVSVAGRYHTAVSPPCARLGVSAGETAITQQAFHVVLTNDSIPFSGVVVESTLLLEHPLDPELRLAGRVAEDGITLGQKESKCAVTLTKTGSD